MAVSNTLCYVHIRTSVLTKFEAGITITKLNLGKVEDHTTCTGHTLGG